MTTLAEQDESTETEQLQQPLGDLEAQQEKSQKSLKEVQKDKPTETEWTGNINVFLGAKVLDQGSWRPAEQQIEAALEVDFRKRHWPVNVVVGYRSGKGSGSLAGRDMTTETSELSVGVRRIWDHFPSARPFFGGGLASITMMPTATLAGLTTSESVNAIGIWLGGGIYWSIGKQFNIGMDLRSSTATMTSTLDNRDFPIGGGHFGLLAGYHW